MAYLIMAILSEAIGWLLIITADGFAFARYLGAALCFIGIVLGFAIIRRRRRLMALR